MKSNFKLLLNTAFTLIEIMVVILIISIAATFVMLNTSNFLKTRHVESTANELFYLLKVAQEQAILQPEVLGLAFSKHNYFFLQFLRDEKNQTGKWQMFIRDRIFKQREIPESVVISVEVQNNSINFAEDKDMAKQQLLPQIIFLPSGDISAFTVSIGTANQPNEFVINAQSNGNITMQKNNKS